MLTKVVIVVLAASALALGAVASRLASERDTTRAQIGRVRSQLVYERGQSAYFSHLVSSLDSRLDGMQRQVNWDKAHLLYCWTVVVRTIPRREMIRPARQRRDAALTTGSLGRNTARCATDAAP